MAPKKTGSKGAKGKAKAQDKEEKKTTKAVAQSKGKHEKLQSMICICDAYIVRPIMSFGISFKQAHTRSLILSNIRQFSTINS